MVRILVSLALAGLILGTAMFATRPGLDQAPPPATPSTSTMRERPFPAVTPSILVEGEIAGVQGGGTLSVIVDGVVQTQQAATSGSFSVAVTGSGTSGMVVIEYAQPGVRLNTNLGSYTRLARLAGTDARLTLDDCACTRISPFSTALQLVVTRAIGRPASNDAQFDDAIRSVGDDLMTATVALALLAEDPAQLPAGHASGLALLEDHPAFVQYLEDTNYAILQDELAPIIEAIPAGAINAADVPTRFALLSPMLDVGTPLATGAWVGERIDASAYKMHGYPTHGDVTHLVEFQANGKFVLQPDRELVFESPRALCPETGQYGVQRQQVLRHEMRRHWSGGRNAIWQVTTDIEYTRPECPGYPAELYRATSFRALADLSAKDRLTTARNFQTVALPTYCDTRGNAGGVSLESCEYAIHAFGPAGQGEVRELGMKVDPAMQPVAADGSRPFSWNMGADGAMHVEAGAERARYWVIDGGDGVALGVVYVAEADRDIGNVSVSGYTAMIRVRRPDVFATVSPLGAWRYGTLDWDYKPSIEYNPTGPFRIVRDASGVSTMWLGSDVLGSRQTWTMADGRLYTATWSTAACMPPVAGCVPSQVRYFRPLARMGNLIHGIEDMCYSVGTTRGASRPQFIESREMPVPPESGHRIRVTGSRAEVTAMQ